MGEFILPDSTTQNQPLDLSFSPPSDFSLGPRSCQAWVKVSPNSYQCILSNSTISLYVKNCSVFCLRDRDNVIVFTGHEYSHLKLFFKLVKDHLLDGSAVKILLNSTLGLQLTSTGTLHIVRKYPVPTLIDTLTEEGVLEKLSIAFTVSLKRSDIDQLDFSFVDCLISSFY
jgi:hypothetical protein